MAHAEDIVSSILTAHLSDLTHTGASKIEDIDFPSGIIYETWIICFGTALCVQEAVPKRPHMIKKLTSSPKQPLHRIINIGVQTNR